MTWRRRTLEVVLWDLRLRLTLMVVRSRGITLSSKTWRRCCRSAAVAGCFHGFMLCHFSYPVPDTSGDRVLFSIDFFVCMYISLFLSFLCFFVSKITRKRLDRFAWNFQGRCGVTMGGPGYIFGQFRETVRCATRGRGLLCFCTTACLNLYRLWSRCPAHGLGVYMFCMPLSLPPSVSASETICFYNISILQYPLMDFHHSFDIGASWDKDELIRFWGQKIDWSRYHDGGVQHSTLSSSSAF